MSRLIRSLVDFSASLKLAVIVILGLAGSLAAATFCESLYDTPTAQFYVYQSFWFHLVLALLAINIFMAAAVRFPWNKRLIPFLLAHVGIEILLIGSLITYRVGLDGSMRVSEGETASVVQLSSNQLQVADGDRAYRTAVRWIPPEAKFAPFSVRERGIPFDLRVDGFMSHADAEYAFTPDASGGAPALKFRVTGGPMQITQDFWLWGGDPQFSRMQAGPAMFALVPNEQGIPQATPGRPMLAVVPQKSGGFSYRAISSSGQVVKGSFAKLPADGVALDPKWKNVKITFLEWIPTARPFANYKPARIQYGQQAPQSAIHVVAGAGGKDAEIWLGLGDRAVLRVDGREVGVAYAPEQVVLPFSIKLNRFTVGHDPGSRDAASYASNVSVIGKEGKTYDYDISMNEPLLESGIKVYQASYEEAEPRPTVSIFSVNRDPGRVWKYTGSLLIVLGTILFAVRRYKRASPVRVPGPASNPVLGES